MKHSLLLACMIFSLANVGYSQSKAETLTNKSVVDLTKAGLGKEVIISQIDASICKFDMSTNGLIALKKANVTDDVINAMINKNKSKAETASTSIASSKKDDKPATKSSGGFPAVDLMNHVYFYNKSLQTVKPLEKSVAGVRTKQGMFGGSAMLQIDGPSSALRLTPETANSFIINTGSSALPELILYRLKSVKGRREVASMKVNSFSGVKTGEDVIPLDITKIKEGVYQVSPNKKVEKGEYFFTGKPMAGASSYDAFAFGVD